MKKTNKLVGLAAGFLALVGVTFTSCGDFGASIGKDDFFGTWETLDFDNSGNKVLSYYAQGANRRIVWKFNGKAENINDGGTFSQVSYNYGSNVPNATSIKNGTDTLDNVTFLYGKYDIKGNSDYSKGKYYMSYQIMIPLKTFITESKPLVDKVNKKITLGSGSSTFNNATVTDVVEVMNEWQLKDFLDLAYGGDGVNRLKSETATPADDPDKTQYFLKNNIRVQVKYVGNKLLCSDVEYFRFNLKDSSVSVSGYTRMMVTTIDKNGSDEIGRTYNQWKNDNSKLSEANEIQTGCLWTGTNTRYMGRISVNSPSINDPIWLCSTTNKDVGYFNLADGADTENYTPSEHDTER